MWEGNLCLLRIPFHFALDSIVLEPRLPAKEERNDEREEVSAVYLSASTSTPKRPDLESYFTKNYPDKEGGRKGREGGEGRSH